MNRFDNFSLLPAIKDSLKTLGFTEATEIQAKIVPMLLENYKQDVHAQAQTGTGKTLAFGLPLLQSIDTSVKGVQALIMAPTRELVLQIYESLKDVSRGTNITMEPIYGGMPIDRQIANIRRGVQVIIGTPGRINDHLRRGTLKLDTLKILVLDEADIMLDMGFREEIDEILNLAPKNRHIWLFSATVMAGIQKLIKSHMTNVVSVKSAQTGQSSAQVKQFYCLIPMRKRIEATVRFIESYPGFYGIIFCRTKALSSEVTEELASKGLKVNCLHGDMKQALRNHVIKGFKNKDFTILVATDVAARGIDVSDLTHVINYSIPDDHESYIHRIGRTGRAGKEGTAILFVTASEMYRLKQIERASKSVIIEAQVPPIEAIIKVKMGAVSDFIEQTKISEEKPSAVDKALQELITSFSEKEVRTALVVALKDKFLRGLNENLESNFADKESFNRPHHAQLPQEICIDLGEEMGLTEDKVRHYLHTTCKVLPQEITKVRVLKTKTFICIPESKLKPCLDELFKNPISSQKYRAYLVQDVFYDKGRPMDRSRGGFNRDRGDRGDRGGSGRPPRRRS